MAKTRILFSTPPYHPHNLADYKVYVIEPLQFEVLSSLVDREQFDIQVIDLRIDRSPGAFERRLREFRPDVVGFTSWTMHVDCIRRLARAAKQLLPSVKVIVGGEHTRIAPEDFAIPEVDFVVMGEAYESFRAVLRAIRDGETALPSVTGVAYQQAGEFISNGEHNMNRSFDLNALPFPDRSVTARYHSQYYHLWWKPLAAVRTAMGCPSRCSFCNLWKVNDGKYLQWDSEYVVDYLKSIDQEYILIVDDHFFGDARRALAIGHAIERAGLRKQFCLYSRADAIAKRPELVELWSRIGLRRVRMGLESYSDYVLESMNKCQSVEHNDQAISILKRWGVLTEGLFMVGLDYTAEDFDNLEHYIRSRQIEVPNITLYTPMPGTDDYKAKRPDMLDTASWYFDFQHRTLPTRLPLQEFLRRYSRLMLRAQLPPRQQLRLIGARTFITRMPSFWRYFWSLRTSYQHYREPPVRENVQLLPWREVVDSRGVISKRTRGEVSAGVDASKRPGVVLSVLS